MYCKNCGKEIASDAKFCPSCGASTGDAPAQPQYQQPVINVINNNANVNRNVGGFGYIHKSKWTAFFLCLFLGWAGVHRFYVGKIGTGLIWLFTFGFFCFGWVFDLLIILIGGFRDKAGQPLI